jgi:MGT family glycosyltransferase
MGHACVLGHPAPGHVNPTLPLIAELVRRGERVTYYATEPFRAKIARTGAAFRAYGAHDLFEANLASGGMLGGMAGLIDTTERILPDLLAHVRDDDPDYLLVEAHAVWGNLLAQILRRPTATLCSMFAINESLIAAADLARHLYGHASPEQTLDGLVGFTHYCAAARRLRARYDVDCPTIVDYLGNPQALNIVFTSRDFQVGGQVFDARYQFVGPSVPESASGADSGQEDVDLAVEADTPLIYVSMGTMYNDEVEFYRACFEAFGRRRCKVVMAVGHRVDRAAIADPPANVSVREYVPQMAVLGRASLFVTHGGINSAHEAMLCGVPMIVLPRAADHYIVAERVAAVGAGIVLNRAQATAARLAELTDAVLEDASYAARSASVGATLRAAGGHRRAADELLAFVHGDGFQTAALQGASLHAASLHGE